MHGHPQKNRERFGDTATTAQLTVYFLAIQTGASYPVEAPSGFNLAPAQKADDAKGPFRRHAAMLLHPTPQIQSSAIEVDFVGQMAYIHPRRSNEIRSAFMLRVVDLFSCIGGHALGLHRAGNFQTVQFVEMDEWRRKVIARHFPEVPLHDDVHTFRGSRGSADVVVGGPPCQRTSVAAAIHGKRTGESLWPEMCRIVGEIAPRWVVVEQPPGNPRWEAAVKADLEAAGYGVARLDLSASGLGAPHIRRRVFLLANRDVSRLAVARAAGSREAAGFARRTADGNPWGAPFTRSLRMADGVSGGLDRRRRIEALGDSNPPVMMTVIGRAILAAESPQEDPARTGECAGAPSRPASAEIPAVRLSSEA